MLNINEPKHKHMSLVQNILVVKKKKKEQAKGTVFKGVIAGFLIT